MNRINDTVCSQIIQLLAYRDAVRLYRASKLFRYAICSHPVYGTSRVGRLVHYPDPVAIRNMSPQIVWRIVLLNWRRSGVIRVPDRPDIWTPCPEWFSDRGFTRMLYIAMQDSISPEKIYAIYDEIVRNYTETAWMMPIFRPIVDYINTDLDLWIKTRIILQSRRYVNSKGFSCMIDIIARQTVSQCTRYLRLAERMDAIITMYAYMSTHRFKLEAVSSCLDRHRIRVTPLGSNSCTYKFEPLV